MLPTATACVKAAWLHPHDVCKDGNEAAAARRSATSRGGGAMYQVIDGFAEHVVAVRGIDSIREDVA